MHRVVLCLYAQARSVSVCTGLCSVSVCAVSVCSGLFCVGMHRLIQCLYAQVCMHRVVLCQYAQAHSVSVCTGSFCVCVHGQQAHSVSVSAQACSVSVCTCSFCVCVHRLILCLCACTGLYAQGCSVSVYMYRLILCQYAHSVVCISVCTGLFCVCLHRLGWQKQWKWRCLATKHSSSATSLKRWSIIPRVWSCVHWSMSNRDPSCSPTVLPVEWRRLVLPKKKNDVVNLCYSFKSVWLLEWYYFWTHQMVTSM